MVRFTVQSHLEKTTTWQVFWMDYQTKTPTDTHKQPQIKHLNSLQKVKPRIIFYFSTFWCINSHHKRISVNAHAFKILVAATFR